MDTLVIALLKGVRTIHTLKTALPEISYRQKWRKQAYFRVHLLDVLKIEQKPFSQKVGNPG